MDKSIKNILLKLPIQIYDFYISNSDKNITEIRIRCGFDIKVAVNGIYHSIPGTYTDKSFIDNLYYLFCENTVSAYEDQTGNGFITLTGGHRVGLGGKYSTDLSGKTILTDITSMNIRLSGFHMINISDDILDFRKGLLIAGKPHSGKTTFIKNICYRLQDKNVVVCDERNELYSEQLNCDYISNLPKYKAIMQGLRTLNPDYIICDELGDERESLAILSGVNSGVMFICSVHSDNKIDLFKKPNVSELMSASVFDKILFLDNNENYFFVKEIVNV